MMQVPNLLIEGQYTEVDLDRLKQAVPIWRVSDILEAQFAALFDLRNPDAIFQPDYTFQKVTFLKNNLGAHRTLVGNWIYFPWDRHLAHALNRNQFYELMYRKNPAKVRPSEQKTLLNSKIGVIGLKLGADFVTTLAHSGIGRHFVLADSSFAPNWSVSENKWSHRHLGLNPMEAVCQQLFDINPYLEIDPYHFELDADSIHMMMTNGKSPQVIIDFESDPNVKIDIRNAAKDAKVPVISPINSPSGVQFVIDQFNASNRPYFNGQFGTEISEILSNPRFAPAIQIRFQTADSLRLASQCIHTVSRLILGKTTLTGLRQLTMKRSTSTT